MKSDEELLYQAYSLLTSSIQGFAAKFSQQEFLEAYKSVQSRQFGLPELGKYDTDVNIPVADMFNHWDPPALLWEYRDQNGEHGEGLYMTAREPIKSGS